MVTSLCELATRLVELGVEWVVMEATSDYWRPPFYLFEARAVGIRTRVSRCAVVGQDDSFFGASQRP